MENSGTRPAFAGVEVNMGGSDSFELDRGMTGKIRVNVISIANLLALLGLIGTAIATWNGLTNKVDILSIRVDQASNSASLLRSDLNAVSLARDSATREQDRKLEIIGNRLTAVETVLQRMERKLENSR